MITKKIDDMGRIMIPKVIRQQLDLAAGDELEITVDLNKKNIMLNKPAPASKFIELIPVAERTLANLGFALTAVYDAKGGVIWGQPQPNGATALIGEWGKLEVAENPCPQLAVVAEMLDSLLRELPV